MKDLNYWKNNAEEDYITTPISVLRYITELEKVKLKEPLFLYVVRCFKIKARSIKKAIWTYVFRLVKEADKVKNFITP